jgi:hypothetical protein
LDFGLKSRKSFPDLCLCPTSNIKYPLSTLGVFYLEKFSPVIGGDSDWPGDAGATREPLVCAGVLSGEDLAFLAMGR